MSSLFHHRVYDVLVRMCGANDEESDRAQWDAFWLRSDDPEEYRFIGALGFGGKFWRGRSDWHVSCYPEDLTPDREERIKRANQALEELWVRWYEEAQASLAATLDRLVMTGYLDEVQRAEIVFAVQELRRVGDAPHPFRRQAGIGGDSAKGKS